MLYARHLNPVPAPQHRRHCRFDASQMTRDQLSDLSRERARLLLDVNHPQCPRAFRLTCQSPTQPSVDGFETPHRVAPAGVSAVEPVKDIEFVGRPTRSGDDVDGGHPAARMGREGKAVDRERFSADRPSKTPHAIVHQPIHPARKQRREIVPCIPQPVAAGEQRDGRSRPAGQIETAVCGLLEKRHRVALLREPVQMNDDVDPSGGERNLVPPQEEVRLSPRMWSQYRRVGEIGLARGDTFTRKGNRQIVHPCAQGINCDSSLTDPASTAINRPTSDT